MPPTQLKHHPIASKLRVEAGQALRLVATYDESSYEVLHIRDDVASQYPPEVLEEISKYFRFDSWGHATLQGVLDVGSLQSQLYEFEDAIVIHIVTGDFRGYVVSVDRDAGLDIGEFLQLCRSEIGQKSPFGPSLR